MQEHDIRAKCVRCVNRSLAAGGLAYHLYVIAALTKPSQAIARMGMVIYDQYFHVCSRT